MFLILQKIASETKKLTPYKLSQYAGKLDECEKSYGIYNNMKRLLLQWRKEGWIKLEPAYEDSPMHLIEITPDGMDYLNQCEKWYGTPPT